MWDVKGGLPLPHRLGGLGLLVLQSVVFLVLLHSCRGQSEVVGPSQPIVATVGDDVILPCYLKPVMNTFDMTLEWTRPDLNPRFVLLWRDGVELETKHPSYKGRTSLFTDELKHGNVSLKLSNVKLSDEGTYNCFVPGLAKQSAVKLVVGSVSSPDVQMTKHDDGVVLECKSEGWYPEPEVLWLDGEGNVLSAGPTETVRGPDDLYTVSSRVTVDKRHGNPFTCRVQHTNINQTRDTHIDVPDDFFSDPSSSASSVPVIIGSIVGIVCLLVGVLVWWKCKRNKHKKKKQHDDEEAGEAGETSRFINKDPDQEVQIEAETHSERPDQKTTTNLNKDETETVGDDRETVREKQTGNNVKTEEEEKVDSTADGTRDQSLMEEEKETLNNVNKEEKLRQKLKTKEREQKKYEDQISRHEGQVKDKEKQINEIKVKLEEVKKKLQSVNREDDTDQSDEDSLDTKTHLETEMEELHKELKKKETEMERMKKEITVITEKKMKVRHEIDVIKLTEMMEKTSVQ